MFQRAKILSYNAINRTAQVHIWGLTDGVESGLTATFAYPVGDDDRDTERQIVDGNDVYVFFEGGDQARPVIAFYSSHGQGNIQDVRRIRQQNIELLAEQRITLQAPEIYLMGHVTIDGDITHHGDQTTSGTLIAQSDVVGGGKSLKSHTHGGVRGGSDSTSQPQ
ncbi:hypothetical protein I2F27_06435 [Acinetobacter sp. B5B]|nr:hypothetical protein [Acinetobacter baretiae]MBF7682964.1 hypothetical protein [Acinetobacter baretiae]